MLSVLPRNHDPRVLVDHATGDDAGVYRLDSGEALVQTVDFFTPVVDDPYLFGAIAAANALSDVYAMGGRPLTALSIACFPEREFPTEWAAAIVKGGYDKLSEAGCLLLGGHSVRDAEIKFGYAITGLVDPAHLLTNAGARAGDALVLTKPLGTGVVATALKAGAASDDVVAAAASSMATLNRAAAEAARRHGARAATDVTGFGLVGHALGLARESGVTLEFDLHALPLLPGARQLARRFQPGGLRANRRAYEECVAGQAAVDQDLLALVFDPQTSGGLLICLPAEAAQALAAELSGASVIGHARAMGAASIVLS